MGGALVGALAGNLVGRALDNQERARLAQATQNAFVAETNVPTTFTVEKTANQSVVHRRRQPWSPPNRSARGNPRRRQHLRADRTHGDQERPDHDRNETFCQAAGSDDPKPVTV